MTFDDVGMAADQEFELHPDPSGTLEYTTKWEPSSFLFFFVFLVSFYSSLSLISCFLTVSFSSI